MGDGSWVCLSPAEFAQLQQYSECEYLHVWIWGFTVVPALLCVCCSKAMFAKLNNMVFTLQRAESFMQIRFKRGYQWILSSYGGPQATNVSNKIHNLKHYMSNTWTNNTAISPPHFSNLLDLNTGYIIYLFRIICVSLFVCLVCWLYNNKHVLVFQVLMGQILSEGNYQMFVIFYSHLISLNSLYHFLYVFSYCTNNHQS